MWCRLQAAHHIGLLKPGSHVAAGPSVHEVAVGDAAGIVWLYDLRQPDAPTLRLPCNSGSSVSCIQWTTRHGAATDTAHRSRRSGGTGSNPGAGGAEVPSSLPSGSRERRNDSAAPDSGLPRGPFAPALRDSLPHVGAMTHPNRHFVFHGIDNTFVKTTNLNKLLECKLSRATLLNFDDQAWIAEF
jgi:hypothetical protein